MRLLDDIPHRCGKSGDRRPSSGLDLPATTEIRVWDITADTRYMVLPVRPAATLGWPAERLVDIVTQEALIGTARLDTVGG